METLKKKSYSIDMCTGSISKKMIRFAIPLMLSGLLQLLFNAADIIVVGRFAGEESLAAVGSTSALINLLTNLFIGMSVGANVLTANYFAADKKEELKKTVHTAMTVSIIGGVFLTVFGFITAPYVLRLMKTPEEILPLASLYLRTYFMGMTAVMVYNYGSAILRAIGDTKRSLYFLTIAGVINVVLNLIFVIAFDMGVLGVGLATVISQVVSAALVFLCLVKEKSDIRLDVKKLCIDKSKLFRIMQIGLPAGFQGMLFSLSNVVIQSSVNSFGKIIVAGNSASSSAEGFAFVAMNSLHQSAISFTSQNLGAKKIERINKILYTALAYVFAVGVFFCAFYLIFGENLIGFYSPSKSVIEAGVKRLTIIACSYMICGMMDVVVGSLRGLGYSIMPMCVSLVGVCAFRVVWIATVFQLPEYHTIETIYYSYPISWVLTLSAHLICYAVAKKRINSKYNTL